MQRVIIIIIIITIIIIISVNIDLSNTLRQVTRLNIKLLNISLKITLTYKLFCTHSYLDIQSTISHTPPRYIAFMI